MRDKANNALNLITVREVELQRKRKVNAINKVLRNLGNTNRLLRRSGAIIIGDSRLRITTNKYQRETINKKEIKYIYLRKF